MVFEYQGGKGSLSIYKNLGHSGTRYEVGKLRNSKKYN